MEALLSIIAIAWYTLALNVYAGERFYRPLTEPEFEYAVKIANDGLHATVIEDTEYSRSQSFFCPYHRIPSYFWLMGLEL
jgi:hypothetical protein